MCVFVCGGGGGGGGDSGGGGCVCVCVCVCGLLRKNGWHSRSLPSLLK